MMSLVMKASKLAKHRTVAECRSDLATKFIPTVGKSEDIFVTYV